MATKPGTPPSVEAYIEACPPAVRPLLEEVRAAILSVVPDAGERISYQIPAVTMGGQVLVYYAAWKRHIGVYPIPAFDGALEAEIGPLRSGRDSIHLPLTAPIPRDLVRRLVAELVARRSDGRAH